MKKPIKVLLYEPGDSGHRPVILRYLAEGLPKIGIEVVVSTDSRYSDLTSRDLDALNDLAQSSGCDLVHLLTVDGVLRRWLWPRALSKSKRLPIVGTYYKFNNLRGLGGAGWFLAAVWGYYDRLLVSDKFWGRRLVLPWLRSAVSFIPDPWARGEFPSYTRDEARRLTGLPLDKKIFLVFGEISQRKGVTRILKALNSVQSSNVLVVFAGRVQADAKEELDVACSRHANISRILLIDRHIGEDMVSPYFHAADAIICDYPRWFIVSSGTFTRALAAGRMSLIPDIGINFECAAEIGSSLVYNAENPGSLAAAIDSYCLNSPPLGARVAKEANSRELDVYLKYIAHAYSKATHI